MLDLMICTLMALPVLGVLIAFTIVTPSWHWVVGFIVTAGAALAWLWITHWIAAATPGYKEGPGGGLGILIVGSWSIAFVIASVGYIVGLIWWHSRTDGAQQSAKDHTNRTA